MKPLVTATPSAWTSHALRDPAALLLDQLQCEMKATTIALSVIAKNAQIPQLVAPMLEIAHEEMAHYRLVHELAVRRGWHPEPITGSPYMSELRRRAGQGPHHALLDRLLLSALIEVRSCERFHLLARAAADPELGALFQGLVAAEARHCTRYVELAEQLYPPRMAQARLATLAELESTILSELPPTSRMHSGWQGLAPDASTARP